MPRTALPEQRALRQAVGAALVAEEGTAVKVPPVQRPQEFIEAAVAHRVSPLLAAQGTTIGLPDDVIGKLKAHARIVAINSLRMASLTAQVSTVLAGAGIKALFIKGVALSQQTTGSLTARLTTDVDLLVQSEDMPRVHNALLDHGFRARATVYPSDSAAWRHARWAGRELAYQRQKDMVDLHWRIAVAKNLFPEAQALMNRCSSILIANQPVATLSVADACAAACLHAYHDGYSQLGYLVDLARLLRQGPRSEPDWHPRLQQLIVDTLAFAEELLPGWPGQAHRHLGLAHLTPHTKHARRMWTRNAGLVGRERFTVNPRDYAWQYRNLMRYAPRRSAAHTQFVAKMAINWPEVEPGTGTVGFLRAGVSRAQQLPERLSQALRD